MPPETSLPFETELKLTLASAEHYERLRDALPPPSRILEQENLFLDTLDHALERRRWALRLRLEHTEAHTRETALLTLKGPSSLVEEATHRVELESEVTPVLWHQAARDGRLPLAALSGPAAEYARHLLERETLLRVRLRFSNRRLVHRLALGGETRELLLDQTRFSTGEVDHEIELEIALASPVEDPASRLTLSTARRALEALLDAAGVHAAPSAMGKLARALSYLSRG